MDLEREKNLIASCKSDLSHFSELYKIYVKDVYRYTYSKLLNQTETEEVVSETFLKALENIQKYEFQGKPLKVWLFVIARNLIYQTYRQPDDLTYEDEWHGVEDESILDKIADKDMIERVEEYIRKFKPPVPEIIRLRVWEEFTFEEIAEILDKKVTAVKMAYYRALEKIQAEFMTEGGIK